jgi:hypothetical protein
VADPTPLQVEAFVTPAVLALGPHAMWFLTERSPRRGEHR